MLDPLSPRMIKALCRVKNHAFVMYCDLLFAVLFPAKMGWSPAGGFLSCPQASYRRPHNLRILATSELMGFARGLCCLIFDSRGRGRDWNVHNDQRMSQIATLF